MNLNGQWFLFILSPILKPPWNTSQDINAKSTAPPRDFHFCESSSSGNVFILLFGRRRRTFLATAGPTAPFLAPGWRRVVVGPHCAAAGTFHSGPVPVETLHFIVPFNSFSPPPHRFFRIFHPLGGCGSMGREGLAVATKAAAVGGP